MTPTNFRMRPELDSALSGLRSSMEALRTAVLCRTAGEQHQRDKSVDLGGQKSSAPVSSDGEAASDRLRAFRRRHGLTQRGLAAEIGVSQGYLGNIESGRSLPSREFARKMSSAYGISADWLLFGRREPSLDGVERPFALNSDKETA